MNNQRIFRSLQVLVIALGFIASSAFAGLVEAKRKGTKVFDKPSKKGQVLKTLSKGETIESMDRKGMYWEVSLGNKTGYVSVMKVKRKKANKSALSEALQKAIKQGRSEGDAANARSRSTVMGVRGLDESDDTAFAGNAKPNLRMVTMMENVIIKSDDLQKLEDRVFREIEKKSE